MHLTINNEKIIRAYETKFLSVIIQHNLKWDKHIGLLLKNKISKSIGIMNKAKHILASTQLTAMHCLGQS